MKIYFVGICGVMMAPIAVAMKKKGYNVEGSDKGIYPPISDYLRNNDITLHLGYKAEHIPSDIDMAVIGAGILPDNPELQQLEKMGVKTYIGYGKFLEEYEVKKNSIVCVGTYGKTTITSFIAFLLDQAGYNESFAIGGLPRNFPDGVRLTDSDWSVTEGDEYINARTDRISRFLYYHPTHLVFSAAKYDHGDVFPTEESYITSFSTLIEKMPSDSKVYADTTGEHVREILDKVGGNKRIVWVNTNPETSQQADISLQSISYTPTGTQFSITTKDGESLQFETPVLGSYVVKDIVMGIAVGIDLGIDLEIIVKAVKEFMGVKRRLEVRRLEPFMVIEDLAHSPVKAQASIDSLRERYPDRKIIAVFEPHTLASKMKSSLPLYDDGFNHADEVLIAPLYHPKSVPEDEQISVIDIVSHIGKNAKGFEDFETLKQYLTEHTSNGDILLFMSSGAFGGLINEMSSILL
jgi:UDP-N-acetylmuramate: L-alanyl-gamma-D-glutamyl-meso-diaminopimelate ligase